MRKDLLIHGVQLKEFGGDIDAVEISALKVTTILCSKRVK